MSSLLKGKTALIIGGSGGIGKAIALQLAANGTNLIVQGSNKEKLSKLEQQIKTLGTNVKVSTIEMLFNRKTATEQLKTLKSLQDSADILIVGFGPFLQKALHLTTDQEWDDTVYWNYTFPGQLISNSLSKMQESNFGRILVFGGTRTHFVNGFRTNAAYSGAKTALCSLVKSVSIEYASKGITCNAVIPGFVETEYLSSELIETLKNKMPQNKLISPDEIAKAALFLLESDSLNGVLLNIDSGWTP